MRNRIDRAVRFTDAGIFVLSILVALAKIESTNFFVAATQLALLPIPVFLFAFAIAEFKSLLHRSAPATS